MRKISDLHRKWLKDPAYRQEHELLSAEFALASAVITARSRAGLTQAQLARRLKTTQSTIARLESGRTLPSTRTLQKLAKATGSQLRISLEPVAAKPASKVKQPLTSP